LDPDLLFERTHVGSFTIYQLRLIHRNQIRLTKEMVPFPLQSQHGS